MKDTEHMLTLADAVAHHAGTRPEASAFVCGASTLSFAELDERARRVAAGLAAMGITPGARVTYLGKNSNAVLEAAVGTIRAGAIFTPLNWRLAPPEMAFMLRDCATTIIFAEAEYIGLVQSIADQVPSLHARLCVDGDAPAGWVDYVAWRNGQPADAPPHAARASDVALQIYTSGTTGRPKGVMLTHRNLRSLPGLEAADWPAWNRWSRDDVSLITSPLFHIGGMGQAVRGLFPGCKQVVLREFSPAEAIQAIQVHGVSRTALVPSALRMMLQDPLATSADFSTLAYVYYGASPIPSDLLRQAMQTLRCGFIQSYGQTETTSAIVALPPHDHVLEEVPHMKSAGKPLPGVELIILDASGQRAPVGVIGEIVTRSSSNMAGYANLPDETAAVLDTDGWLRTGDAGHLDEDGYLYVHDRLKEMIITGGENVYPAEVENALYGHPAVSDVAVIGVPSEKWGQAVKAVVELRPGQQATEVELIDWARQRIGGYKLPKSIDFVDALPRNSTGKVVKGELRRCYANPGRQE